MRVRKRADFADEMITDIESEISRIRSLRIADLRSEWTAMFKRVPPKALTKDLLARTIIFRIQEEAYGGFDRATLKLLEAYAKGKPTERLRRLKPGTELVREYQGESHKVIVVENGFVWSGKTYSSLTMIAREITGTAWNGPRFFGLRGRGEREAAQSAVISRVTGTGGNGEVVRQ